ncbi:hypothetical protein DTO212C5_8212 [Paecilomyces variotii]|nr:hypothetical protein DTO212C5_8212 [Paecilomyces variotii]
MLFLLFIFTGSAAPTPTALNATATRSKSATSESVSASAGGASFEYWGSASLYTRHVFASAGAIIVLAIGLAVAWRLAGLPPISQWNLWYLIALRCW